jgi:hypothetical protein
MPEADADCGKCPRILGRHLDPWGDLTVGDTGIVLTVDRLAERVWDVAAAEEMLLANVAVLRREGRANIE